MTKRILLSLALLVGACSAQSIKPTFFGMGFNSWKISPPTDANGNVAKVSDCRNWDSGDKLGQINSAPGVYNFKGLDAFVAKAKALGCQMLYTLGDTPAYMVGTLPPKTPCVSPGPASCEMPIDVNPDGTGTDAMMIRLATDFFTHYGSTFARLELWNEPDCKCFFNGTTAQLVRITKDWAAIARKLAPGIEIYSPSFHGASMATQFDAYYKAGGTFWDTLDVHMRASGSANATAESFLTVLGLVQAELLKLKIHPPLVDGEYGILKGQMTDPDLLQAFYGSAVLLRAGAALTRQYPYQWDSPAPYGFQGSPNGNAYDRVAAWLSGKTIGACSPVGTVYTCPVSSGELAVWDSAQTCSAGKCTTRLYRPPGKFSTWQDLNGNISTVNGKPVAIGKKPIMLFP